jgi:hypothetical protein
MATKHICDKCGSKEEVRRVKIISYDLDDKSSDDRLLFDKDFCLKCRQSLGKIAVKFLHNDEIEFIK